MPQCFGKTEQKRCQNKGTFLFFLCDLHKKQLTKRLFKLLLWTIPAGIVMYYKFFGIIGWIPPSQQSKSIEIVKNAKDTLYIEVKKIKESKKNNVEEQIDEDDYEIGYELPTDASYGIEIGEIAREKYENIIYEFEKGNKEKAFNLLYKTFDIDTVNCISVRDKYLGYIAATYRYLQKFDKALEIVLERNRNRKRWDYSLKTDVAECIRYFYLQNSLIETISLIDNMRKKYDSNLLSYFWILIPTQKMQDIEKGMHSKRVKITKQEIKDIKAIIKKYPEEPFIDYAYYVLKNYGLAINIKNSRIKDVVLYAAGYNIVNSLFEEYSNSDNDDFYYFLNSPPADKQSYIEQTEKAITFFKEYINDYPKAIHADDASYWIGWLYANIGEYETSYKYLIQTSKLGNHDYNSFITNYLPKVINRLNEEKRLEIADSIFTGKVINQRQEDFVANILIGLENNDKVIDFCRNKGVIGLKSFAKYCNKLFYKKQYVKLYNVYLLAIKNNFNEKLPRNFGQYVYNQIDSAKKITSYKNYIKLVLKVRYNDSEIGLAITLLDIGIEKLKHNYNVDYMGYLKVRYLVIYNPTLVETNVEEFIENFPNSSFTDDVLAELIYVQLNILDYADKGFENLEKLIANYPRGNALDNALNIVNDYYFDKCELYETVALCKYSMKMDSLIINNYEISSYKSNAINRLSNAQRILNMNQSPDSILLNTNK